MDIYRRRSYWKWVLAIIAMIVVLISVVYTQYLAGKLTIEERKKAEQYGKAVIAITESASDTTTNFCDFTFHWEVMRSNTTVPSFLIDEAGNIEDYRNIGEDSSAYLDPYIVQRTFERMSKSGDTMQVQVVNKHFKKTIVYSDSMLLGQLKLYPLIQFILISAFIFFGYLLFSASRRAEENQVWVGMAKETAHQLGTPITAIMGWIEHLRIQNEGNEANLSMFDELENDVFKLELIADRFSKIGSTPELEPINIYEQLNNVHVYMKRRAPRRVVFAFPDPNDYPALLVRMNLHLFDWVIENLLRNSIDAMEHGEGKISCKVIEQSKDVFIEITDTGKGIPQNKLKTIFKPGYSTKKRGWGLGLSLSKRIVNEYHGGDIFVKHSEPNVATTFVIKLAKG
jgi:Histidine kinase-, DNA gyrase B-, and HSP90-like ATPase